MSLGVIIVVSIFLIIMITVAISGTISNNTLENTKNTHEAESPDTEAECRDACLQYKRISQEVLLIEERLQEANDQVRSLENQKIAVYISLGVLTATMIALAFWFPAAAGGILIEIMALVGFIASINSKIEALKVQISQLQIMLSNSKSKLAEAENILKNACPENEYRKCLND